MTAATAPDANELDLIRDTADRIARRCLETDQEGHAACWNSLVEAGFTELRTPGDAAAPAASAAVTSVVVERLARVVCGAPLLGHLLATELCRLAGVPAGPAPRTVVLDHGWTGLSTGAGTAWDASSAENGLALLDSGITALVLSEPTGTVDPTRPIRAAAGESGAQGTLTAQRLHEFDAFARTLLAADMLGAASGIFDDAVAYARERVQFGVPVGSFQAVQHLCAEAHVRLEGLRSVLDFAERALDAGDAGAGAAAMVAKSYAEDAAIGGAEAAIQVFGGIAITAEHRAHRHLRRVLVDRPAFGDAAALNDRLLDLEEES